MDEPGYTRNLSDSLEHSRTFSGHRARSFNSTSLAGTGKQLQNRPELLGRRGFLDWNQEHRAAQRFRLFGNDRLRPSSGSALTSLKSSVQLDAFQIVRRKQRPALSGDAYRGNQVAA